MNRLVCSLRKSLLALCVVFAITNAWATNYTVPCASGGTGTDLLNLNSDINTADADSSPSTVTLGAGCTYAIGAPFGLKVGGDGSPTYFQPVTNNVTIVGNGATLVMNNTMPQRFFFVMPNGALVLQNLTLRGGIAHGDNGHNADGISPAPGGAYSGLGGAVFNTGAFVADEVTFDGNQAVGGDGGCSTGGGGGGAGGAGIGGALFSAGTVLILSRNSFTNNSATGGINGEIGGVCPASTTSAGGGGGGKGGSGGVSTGIAANGGYGGGGGSRGLGGSSGSGGFGGGGGAGFGTAGEFGGRGDLAGAGGAVFIDSTAASTLLTNNTFSANAATGGATNSGGDAASGAGGGLFLHNGSATVAFNTFVGNSAVGGSVVSPLNPQSAGDGEGGGLYVYAGAVLSMVHTLVSGNTVTAGASGFGGGAASDADIHGAVNSGGYNLVTTRGDSTGYVASDLADGTSSNLGPLQNNGGPTLTYLPLPGSPAIDADVSSGCNFTLTTDQRGAPRLFGSGCDIGAVEVNDIIFRNGFEVPAG
jgi:hypothetical protein